MDKQKVEEKKQVILELLKGFCVEQLDEEYLELSERMVKKLGRKRTVPFMTGQPQVWAAAIIHALGTINFLFDKSFEPYVTIDEINDFFGTKKSTTGSKSKQIRDMLKLGYFDDEFGTSKMKDNNPFDKYVMVDGLIVPLDSIPEQYQQMVKEARAKGGDLSFTTQ